MTFATSSAGLGKPSQSGASTDAPGAADLAAAFSDEAVGPVCFPWQATRPREASTTMRRDITRPPVQTAGAPSRVPPELDLPTIRPRLPQRSWLRLLASLAEGGGAGAASWAHPPMAA